MRKRIVRFGGAAAIATILLCRPSSADAAVLLPGSTVNPDILPGAAGVLVDSVTQPLAGVGSITAAVVLNALGTLDFYYQIANNAGSGHNLARNSNNDFSTAAFLFATEVFYRLDNGGLGIFGAGDAAATPLTADRDASGVVVGFNFTGIGTPAGTRINPGETSRILVIRTNATEYMPGSSFVINGVVAGAETFAPLAAVPEPASLALLSSAFAAAGYLSRKRNGRRKTLAV